MLEVYMRRRNLGFTLVELLAVVAIIGIVSAIAVPAYLGTKDRARNVGDAQANAKTLMMAMEGAKAENGVYPTAGNYTWTGGVSPSPNPLSSFSLLGGTKLNFNMIINADRLTYTINVTSAADPSKSLYKVDQTGAMIP